MKNDLYRKIPKVDVLLEDERIRELISNHSRELVMDCIRLEINKLRRFIGVCEDLEDAEREIHLLATSIEKSVEKTITPNMKMVINGTGTIIHTNLGRAPMAPHHLQHVYNVSMSYSNLEYNLEQGGRGARYDHFEQLLCELTGAEAAMAVNNNAAAVMLILNALAKNKDIIVSRGELVEVGGKFRIPDVMDLSRGNLVEIGTTNKTHLDDYEEAIGENTGLLMKVHTSNYKILGFTESVGIEALSELGKEHDIPVVEDLGSGVLIDLAKYGLTHEPTVQESIQAGADVVCFSGDKLLGGPQAGIIVGKKKYIDIMKKNQLTRALRIDKFTAAALEAVLMEYRSEENAINKIPVLRMISMNIEEIKKDANTLYYKLVEAGIDERITLKIVECESQIGGGSMPLETLKSYGVTLKPSHMTITEYDKCLRSVKKPIIGRIINDEILIDMRTMHSTHIDKLVHQIKDI